VLLDKNAIADAELASVTCAIASVPDEIQTHRASSSCVSPNVSDFQGLTRDHLPVRGSLLHPIDARGVIEKKRNNRDGAT
jgi:hypothetical protein